MTHADQDEEVPVRKRGRRTVLEVQGQLNKENVSSNKPAAKRRRHTQRVRKAAKTDVPIEDDTHM